MRALRDRLAANFYSLSLSSLRARALLSAPCHLPPAGRGVHHRFGRTDIKPGSGALLTKCRIQKISLSLSHLFALPRACHQGVLKDPPPGVPPHCLVNKVIFHVCFSSRFYYIKEALSPPLLYKSCPLLYKESVPVRKPMLGWPCRAFPLVPYGFLWAFYGAPYGPRTS